MGVEIISNHIETQGEGILLEYTENFEMVDIWRVLNPEKKNNLYRGNVILV